MPDGSVTSGPYSHPERSRRDGYHDTLHPETGERLLLARYEVAQQIASGGGWSTAFELQQRFAGMSPAAWWPVSGWGVDGGIAYVAYPVWKATLADDISKGYRCKGPEAVALASCLIDGLAQLEAVAQRPHAALRTTSVVFPGQSGGDHDSLSPRLTGLVPIEETDPRQHHADRRQVGYLLYGAIIGADPNFRSEPEFGSVWEDINIPDKKGWKKLIEELTSGALDNQPYDQIRKRLGRLGGGGGGKLVWVGAGVAGVAVLIGVGFGMGWFKGGTQGPPPLVDGNKGGDDGKTGGSGDQRGSDVVKVVPVTNPPIVEPTNPPVVDVPPQTNPVTGPEKPDWEKALGTVEARGLVSRISPGSLATSARMRSGVEAWWSAVPRIPADVWLKLEYPAPGPLEWDGAVVGVLETEYARRVGYTNALAALRAVQGRMPTDAARSVGALGWGQPDLEGMLTARGLVEARALVERMGTLTFTSGFNPGPAYATALSNAVATVGIKSDRFAGWSGLKPAEKSRAVATLGSVWRTNIQGWAAFSASPDPAIERAFGELVRFAGTNQASVSNQLERLRGDIGEVQLKARTRGFTEEKALRDAELQVLAGLRGVTNELERIRSMAADQLEELRRQEAARLAEQRRKELERLSKQDQDWATAADTMGRTNLVQAVRQLEELLRAEEGRGLARTNFPTSAKFVTDRKSAADRLAENLRNDAEWVGEASGPEAKRDPKTALTTLQQRLQGKATNDFPKSTVRLRELGREVAVMEDGEWARAALGLARTGTLEDAIESLTEKGVGGAGGTGTNSAALLVKLNQAKTWLGQGPMALKSPDWKPASTRPMPTTADWMEYADVKKGLAAYDGQGTAWTNAVMQAGQVTGFGAREQFTRLREQLNAGELANKTGLRTQRERAETLVTAIGLIESGRAGGTASSIANAIAEAEKHREIKYFSNLLPALEADRTRLKENEDRLAREQREKEELARKSEAIKAKMVEIAESVGGVKLFGRDIRRVAGVTANVARVKKRDLATQERAYFELNPDDSTVRAEVQALQKRLDGIIAND